MNDAADAAISISRVSKSFGAQRVLNDLSTSFAPGELVLLLGANGAGKSTLLRICAGMLRPERGSVRQGNRALSSASIGYCGHQPLLYGALSVAENLSLMCDLLGLKTPLDTVLKHWELEEQQHTRLSDLSKGQQAKAGLARALLHQPPVVLLDEPTSSLDERACALLLKLLEENRAAHQGRAVTVIATHDLARLAQVATRVIVLAGGQVAADSSSPGGSTESVIAQYREKNR